MTLISFPPTESARERQHEALLMLIQREGKVVKRSPWRQLGWYTFAVGWVDQQLSMQPKDHKGFLWSSTLSTS